MPEDNDSIKKLLVTSNKRKLNDSELREIQTKKYNLEEEGEDGDTLLINAAMLDDAECLVLLITAGVNLNHKNNKRVTALISAASFGNIGCVNALIAAGANPNVVDADGDTALISAARFGWIDCVNALIAAGAHINNKNNEGRTALLVTGLHGLEEGDYFDCQMALLMAGAHPGHHQEDSAKYLWGLIKACDIRDTRVPFALAALYEQQITLNSEQTNEIFDLSDQEIEEAGTYLKKLQEIHELHKKNVFNAIHQGTAIVRKLPMALIDLIAQYDLSYKTPLEDERVTETKNINKLLACEKYFFARANNDHLKPGAALKRKFEQEMEDVRMPYTKKMT